MIYCTIGVPSRFSEWCEALLGELVAATGDRPTPFVADGLEQIGHEMLARLGADSTIAARQPKSGLLKSLFASGHPFMVTIDSPENTIGALMVDYGVPFADAVRKTAGCLAAMVPVMKAKNALVLRSSEVLSAEDAAAAIAGHFGLRIEPAVLSAAAARCPMREPPTDTAFPALPAIDLPPAIDPLRRVWNAPIHTGAVQPLWDHLQRLPLREIVWSPALFWLGDAPAETATRLFDVTGSSRCLIFGPYIRLPEGPWSCSIMLGFSQRAVGLRLVADVVAGTPLSRVEFEVDEPGVFEIEFSFVNSNPDLPVEVRLFNASAAFEGEIMLGQVRMVPLGAKRLTVS